MNINGPKLATDLTCTICINRHSIRQGTGDMPLTFVVSDQGFPGVMVGGRGDAWKSVRIEDGGLHEVTDLFIEMFSGGLASGTIILLGSVTSMLHKGSRGYVFDWLACAKKLNCKWGNVKVCPMIPFWNDTIPGKCTALSWRPVLPSRPCSVATRAACEPPGTR